METIILVVLIVGIAAYYGFMKSLETGAGMASREVEHLDLQHKVSVAERTASLADRLDDDTLTKAAEVRAKLEALKL